MPSFTFSSTANAFVLRGAVPVFIDVTQDTINMDASQIEVRACVCVRAFVCVRLCACVRACVCARACVHLYGHRAA
jgi:dTDP-4-amino-4,6-dideoxygalactose transaminase